MRTTSLQSNFQLGMKRDLSRDQLPNGAAWDLVDYIPSRLGAPLTRRGGWTYGSPLMTTTPGRSGSQYLRSLVYAEFANGAKLVGVDEDGHVIRIDSSSSAVTAGQAHTVTATALIAGPPVFYRDKVIICDPEALQAPMKYTGTGTVAALGGSPPEAGYACVYKDRLILARNATATATENTFYISEPGDPEDWDPTVNFGRTSYAIRGLANLKTLFLIFHEGHISRVRFDIAPNLPNSDMVVEDLFAVGLNQQTAATITVADDLCFFANPAGVFMTDGIALVDLTAEGGIKDYWSDKFKNWTSAYRMSGGFHNGYFFVSAYTSSDGAMTSPTPALTDCLICEVRTRSWFRLSNVMGTMFASVSPGTGGSAGELYLAQRGAHRVIRLAPLLTASAGTDADSTVVRPVLATPYYRLAPSRKRWHDLYVSDATTYATTAPTFDINYSTDPSVDPSTGTPGTIVVTAANAYQRTRRRLNKNSEGMSFWIKQSNTASTDTRLYGLETGVRAIEPSRP